MRRNLSAPQAQWVKTIFVVLALTTSACDALSELDPPLLGRGSTTPGTPMVGEPFVVSLRGSRFDYTGAEVVVEGPDCHPCSRTSPAPYGGSDYSTDTVIAFSQTVRTPGRYSVALRNASNGRRSLLDVDVNVAPAVCTTAFVDAFDRADGVPGNGWITVPDNNGVPLAVYGNALRQPATSSSSAIFRSIDMTGSVSVSATVTQAATDGVAQRYDARFLFGGPGTLTGGYGIAVSKAGAGSPSWVRVLLNGAAIDSVRASFDFGASVVVVATLSPDQTLRGSVSGAGHTFLFGFRSAVSAPMSGHNLTLSLGVPGPAGVAVDAYPTMDDLTIRTRSCLPGPPALVGPGTADVDPTLALCAFYSSCSEPPPPPQPSATVTMQWTGSPGATRYHLSAITPTTGIPAVDTDTITSTSYQVTIPHAWTAWTVAACNDAGCSDVPAVLTFTTP